jgi:hypothetical protein
VPPLVRHLEAERVFLLRRKLLHLIEAAGVLRDDGALLELRDDIVEVMFGGKVLDILHENISRNVGERIGDPAVEKILVSKVSHSGHIFTTSRFSKGKTVRTLHPYSCSD